MRVELECQQCGSPFEVVPSRADTARYCSRDCFDRAVRARHGNDPEPVTLTCEQCGGAFEVPPSRTDRRRHCGRACRDAALTDRVTLTCEQCGGAFEVTPAEAPGRQFCGYSCMGASKRARVTLTCETCFGTFEVIPSRADTARYCSAGCAPHQAGEPKPLQGAELRRRIVALLRDNGPLLYEDLMDRFGACQSALERLKDERVVIHLGSAAGGYHLAETLPEVARPRGWARWTDDGPVPGGEVVAATAEAD